MPFGLDSTKTAARPSHEAIESTGGEATDIGETPMEHVDHVAMESAKRAQIRIHENEGKDPGTQIFTK
jgi:hypothetical protein